MNRKYYRKIAKKYNTSISQVKKEMQQAINCAYQNPNSFALAVKRKDAVPTINEFLNHTINYVDKNNN